MGRPGFTGLQAGFAGRPAAATAILYRFGLIQRSMMPARSAAMSWVSSGRRSSDAARTLRSRRRSAAGLSMDYEVFLLSRVHEAWVATRDAHRSVAIGIGSTARVITTAAAIMVVVFASFVLDTDPTVKMLSIGMAFAVLIDASLVRMMLVPSVMALLGERAWWMPRWLEPIVPHLQLEGSTEPLPVAGAEPETVATPPSEVTPETNGIPEANGTSEVDGTLGAAEVDGTAEAEAAPTPEAAGSAMETVPETAPEPGADPEVSSPPASPGR